MSTIENIARQVVDSAYQVHSQLGPGLLESSYELCLCHELSLRQIRFQRQLSLPLQYKGLRLESGYRIDLLVEDQLIVELKAVKALEEIHRAQLLTYLKLQKRTLGLLINFNTTHIKDGIKRVVHNHPN